MTALPSLDRFSDEPDLDPQIPPPPKRGILCSVCGEQPIVKIVPPYAYCARHADKEGA